MEMPFHVKQLDFMIEIVRHRIEFLNPFFYFLNFFDTEYFFFLLIPIVWLGFSYKWGIRVFYLFSFTSVSNTLLKWLVGWPRPSTDMPELGMFHFKSFGFPSGAAQISLLLGGLLIAYWKNKKAAWPIGISYILLISFSRIYLGVHYPIDILGGWLFGLATLLLFIRFKEPLETFFAKKDPFFSLVLSQAIPLSLLFFPTSKFHYLLGSFLGVGLGIFFSLKKQLYLPDPTTLRERLLRSSLALFGLLFIYSVWPTEIPLFAKSFAFALWLSLGASPFCKLFLNTILIQKK